MSSAIDPFLFMFAMNAVRFAFLLVDEDVCNIKIEDGQSKRNPAQMEFI